MNCLVIGGEGALGTAISDQFKYAGFSVWTSSRKVQVRSEYTVQITGDPVIDHVAISSLPVFDVVVWAQGTNLNDSVLDVDLVQFAAVFQANTAFVVSSLQQLLKLDRIKDGAHLCVISSIWENVIRTNKLSYSMSKAALSAFVKSAAIDLSKRGIFVNAVLPGVLDTPMTRSVLSAEQIRAVENKTGFGRLVSPTEVAQVVAFLCSEMNQGVNGQSVVVDLGFSNVREV